MYSLMVVQIFTGKGSESDGNNWITESRIAARDRELTYFKKSEIWNTARMADIFQFDLYQND